VVAARRLIVLLAVVVPALVAAHPLLGAVGGESGGEPAVGRVGAGPLLDVSSLAPGRAVEAPLTIANAGSAPGTFVLGASTRGSRLLAQRLRLVVSGGEGVLYEGSLSDLGGVRLALLAPGQKRRFTLQATLPSSLGNELQGLAGHVELGVTVAA
jgi:hypothetical protein